MSSLSLCRAAPAPCVGDALSLPVPFHSWRSTFAAAKNGSPNHGNALSPTHLTGRKPAKKEKRKKKKKEKKDPGPFVFSDSIASVISHDTAIPVQHQHSCT